MKNLLILAMCLCTTALFAQSKTNCDPELQREIDKISNMGGTFLKSIFVSSEDLKGNTKNSVAKMLFKSGISYRFYVKSTSKYICETTLTLTEEGVKNPTPLINIHQKSNEAVAFKDIKINKKGVYLVNVSFKDNEKGCAIVVISYLDDQHNTAVVDTSKTYTEVDEHAQFKGGDINNFRDYVAENFHLDTVEARGVSAKIFIQFVVNTAGKVQQVKVLRGSGHPKIDSEAVNVIKSSPSWKPAKLKGECVKEQFVLPIQIN